MTGLKDLILAAEDLPHEDHDVAEWGGVTVRVRGLSGTDRDSYYAHSVALKKAGQDVGLRMANYRSRMLVKCLFDPETDELVFGGNEIAKLGAKSSQVIDRLFKVAQRLSGIGDDADGTGEGADDTDA